MTMSSSGLCKGFTPMPPRNKNKKGNTMSEQQPPKTRKKKGEGKIPPVPPLGLDVDAKVVKIGRAQLSSADAKKYAAKMMKLATAVESMEDAGA